MTQTCKHIAALRTDKNPIGAAATSTGCVDCQLIGDQWLHLRRCLECGHIGCCDSSPNQHASAHAGSTGHPLIQSFESGEEWIYCYVDDQTVEFDGMPPSPAHP